MAIIAALLVPALIHYTEDSRAQKDVTTMDEVVNAVQLALADSDCFDEMELYSCDNNFITYTDSSGKYGQQVIDAEYWAPDGCAKATTITFNPEKGPNGETIYRLENAVINDMTYGNGSIAISRPMEGAQVEDNQCLFPNAKLKEGMDSGYMYNKLKATIGTSVITTSATYANSSFTIFIRFSQKDGVTVADINGAFNGTNLTEGASASMGSGTNTEIINPDTGNKEQGPATEDGGTQKNQYTSSALQGGGNVISGGTYRPVTEDYKQPTYVQNLQKEHKFEYYSTLKLAVDDVNANTIGKHADRDKHNAVAGIYVDKDGRKSIALLRDANETETSVITTDLILNLGGRTIYNSVHAIEVKGGSTVVDGSIPGSGIKIKANQNSSKLACIFVNSANLTVYGGEYYADANGYNITVGGIPSSGASKLDLQNLKIELHGANAVIVAVQVKEQGVATIKDCDIYIDRPKGIISSSIQAQGILSYGTFTMENSRIESYADVYDANHVITGGIAVIISGGNAMISNCELFGTAVAFGISPRNNYVCTVDNCQLQSSYISALLLDDEPFDGSIIIKNSALTQTSESKGYSIPNEDKAALNTQSNDEIKIHNCIINAFKNAIYANENFKISGTTIGEKSIQISENPTVCLGRGNDFDKNDFPGNCTIIETPEIYDK